MMDIFKQTNRVLKLKYTFHAYYFLTIMISLLKRAFQRKKSSADHDGTHIFGIYLCLLSWSEVPGLTQIKCRSFKFLQRLFVVNSSYLFLSAVFKVFLRAKSTDFLFDICVIIIALNIYYTFINGVVNNKHLCNILNELNLYTQINTEEFWQKRTYSGNTSKETYKKIDRISIRVFVFQLAAVFVSVTYAAANRKLILRSWYYFDTSFGWGFATVTLLQYIAAFSWGINNVTNIMLYVKVVYTMCKQFDFIGSALRSVGNFEEELSKEDYNFRTKQQLREIIVHHQRLLKLLEDVKSFYNKPFFILISSGAAEMCCAVYIMLTANNLLDYRVLATITILLNMLAQVCLACRFGDMLTEKVESVRDAAYDSAWVEGDVSFRRSILIVMQQGSKPFHLTAGWIAKINLPVLSQIIQDAGSYVMVMIAIAGNHNI